MERDMFITFSESMRMQLPNLSNKEFDFLINHMLLHAMFYARLYRDQPNPWTPVTEPCANIYY